MKDKHVNPLLKSMGLLSTCILGLNVSLSATRSVKKKKNKPTSVAFCHVHWEINSVTGKKWETFHRGKEKID